MEWLETNRSIPGLKRFARALAGFIVAVSAAFSGRAQAVPQREPDVPPAPYIRLDGRAPGQQLQIDFPAAAHGGVSRSLYWLTGGEALEIDVQVTIGPDAVVPPVAVTGVLVIDGRQQRISIDGGPLVDHYERRIAHVGDVQHFVIRVPGRAIPRGRHPAALLLWNASGAPFGTWGFDVMKDEDRRQPRPPSSLFRLEPEPPARQPSLLRWGRAPFQPLSGRRTPLRPERGGRLPLRLEVRRLDRGPWDESYTVVGFLDGRQVALGALGRAPYVRLPQRLRGEASLELHGIRGAGPHTLILFLLTEPDDASNGPTPRTTSAVPPLWLGASVWAEASAAGS